jgi:hypothetical protein
MSYNDKEYWIMRTFGLSSKKFNTLKYFLTLRYGKRKSIITKINLALQEIIKMEANKLYNNNSIDDKTKEN